MATLSVFVVLLTVPCVQNTKGMHHYVFVAMYVHH